MKHTTGALGSIILFPESLEEAGLLQWLAARFTGPVVFTFDTTQHLDCATHPALWIYPTELAKEPQCTTPYDGDSCIEAGRKHRPEYCPVCEAKEPGK